MPQTSPEYPFIRNPEAFAANAAKEVLDHADHLNMSTLKLEIFQACFEEAGRPGAGTMSLEQLQELDPEFYAMLETKFTEDMIRNILDGYSND